MYSLMAEPWEYVLLHFPGGANGKSNTSGKLLGTSSEAKQELPCSNSAAGKLLFSPYTQGCPPLSMVLPVNSLLSCSWDIWNSIQQISSHASVPLGYLELAQDN